MAKTIAQGAEAKIILDKNKITKLRTKKSYRIPFIDEKLRKSRTKKEVKLMIKASKIINVPLPKIKEPHNLEMAFIKGLKLSEHLDKLKNKISICNQIGNQIASLHNENIIHGDLTTSNMILVKDKVFFIDFGLGFISYKFEDKAVDLHLLKQALEAKHYKYYKEIWKAVKSGYKNKDSKKVLGKLKAVEKQLLQRQ